MCHQSPWRPDLAGGYSEGMRASRFQSVLLGVLLVIGLLMGAYVAGYYTLCETVESSTEKVRSFSPPWLVTIYGPAAVVEAFLLQKPVSVLPSGPLYVPIPVVG